ncbi:2-dehydro-3-deoxygalactonokinase [Rhodococcus sp. NPDC127528]|uniref:2-dehydro-3-deoxygalactonokinase n=1 Tax=unclassified Rhodococcus (in: high G+C Gram-positive bacteria) TaxID=192944 RepID=UPI00363700DE
MIDSTTAHPTPRLVALDWGTTSLRAWLLGDDGRILDSRRHDDGLLSTTARDEASRTAHFAATFDRVCGDWLRAHPGLPAIACGMVGSAQGWHEAGYLTVPTDLRAIADALSTVRHDRGVLHLVPGLRMPSEPGGRVPGDVLRGEETQLLGVLPDGDAHHTVVLPGTHTKWVQVEDRKVTSFATAMSGELYGLVLEHGILGRTAAPAVRDDAAFARGLATGASVPSRGLTAELFGARALVLDGLLAPSALPDYVSGVIIADEVAHLLPHRGEHERILLCGTADLCRRYATALAAREVTVDIVTEEASAHGLWSIALSAGLVEPTERGARTQKEQP